MQRHAKRCAFILGNSQYGEGQDLPNAVNDAHALAEKLSKLGFKVVKYTDLTASELNARFNEFLNYMKIEGHIETALIYYSGHGFQEGGINYLVSIPDPDSNQRFVPLQDLIEKVSNLSMKKIIFLDACRKYLNTEHVADQLSETREFSAPKDLKIEKGFKAINADQDTFIAYSAAPGEVAFDGDDGSKLSPFTNAVLEFVGEVDLSLTVMMARVRNSVSHMTGKQQKTWDSSSLTSAFFFNPSSLLMLIGNAIGLLAVLTTLVPLSINLLSYGFSNPVFNLRISDQVHGPTGSSSIGLSSFRAWKKYF